MKSILSYLEKALANNPLPRGLIPCNQTPHNELYLLPPSGSLLLMCYQSRANKNTHHPWNNNRKHNKIMIFHDAIQKNPKHPFASIYLWWLWESRRRRGKATTGTAVVDLILFTLERYLGIKLMRYGVYLPLLDVDDMDLRQKVVRFSFSNRNDDEANGRTDGRTSTDGVPVLDSHREANINHTQFS